LIRQILLLTNRSPRHQELRGQNHRHNTWQKVSTD
jgi:hypothetical protein